jgi:hypothetical protein
MIEGGSKPSLMGGLAPQAVDIKIREAIGLCWFMLPEEQRSWDQVEKEISRIVKRALDNYRDDLSTLNKFIG